MAFEHYSPFNNPSAFGGFSSGSDQSGKTVPLGVNTEDDERTVVFASSSKIDPAVGWLVCIRGADKGRSYRLVKGNNSIGRPGNGNRYGVELSDQAISRKGAAGIIIYNEKGNSFFITPGDLTINVNMYLNDEILLSPQKLKSRAVIEVAGDTLIFVPLCGEKFVWKTESPESAPKEEKPLVNKENEQKGIIRCPKGHYYNGDINDFCPYCRELEKNDPDGVTKII